MDRNRIETSIQTGTGITAGYYAYKYAKFNIYKINHRLLWKMRGETPQTKIEQIKTAGLKYIDNYKTLKDSNLEVTDLSKIDFNKFLNEKLELFSKNFDTKINTTKNPIKKWFLKRRKPKMLATITHNSNQVLEGKNAYFFPKSQITINMEKAPEMLFHELGHVIDYKNYNFVARLRHFKAVRKLPSAILITTLFTNSKPNEKQENNKLLNAIYKTGAFVKNNCGKLMLLSFIPLVGEEGLASLHGQKNAKKYIDKTNMKYITKSHLHSFASYCALAGSAGFAIF